MHEINLLPWRELLRKKVRRQNLRILGIGSFIILLTWVCLYVSLVFFMQREKIEIKKIQTKLSGISISVSNVKECLQEHLQFTQALAKIKKIEQHQVALLKLFNLIVSFVPLEITLNDLQKKDDHFIFGGFAQNILLLTTFMQRFTHAELQQIKNQSPAQLIFQFQATQNENAVLAP